MNSTKTVLLADDEVFMLRLLEATFRKGGYRVVQARTGKEALGLAKRLGDGLERSDAYRSGQYRQAPLPQNSGVA